MPDARPAFLTGSRVYGRPREDSDVDLVVFVPDEDERAAVFMFSDDKSDFDEKEADPGKGFMYGCRFGRLNLILCDAEKYDAFRAATDELIGRRPVTRDEAVAVMKRHRGDPDA